MIDLWAGMRGEDRSQRLETFKSAGRMADEACFMHLQPIFNSFSIIFSSFSMHVQCIFNPPLTSSAQFWPGSGSSPSRPHAICPSEAQRRATASSGAAGNRWSQRPWPRPGGGSSRVAGSWRHVWRRGLRSSSF